MTTLADYCEAYPQDAAKRIERLEAALKPFAAAVFNDNGDMTVSYVNDAAAYTKAYFVHKRTLT